MSINTGSQFSQVLAYIDLSTNQTTDQTCRSIDQSEPLFSHHWFINVAGMCVTRVRCQSLAISWHLTSVLMTLRDENSVPSVTGVSKLAIGMSWSTFVCGDCVGGDLLSLIRITSYSSPRGWSLLWHSSSCCFWLVRASKSSPLIGWTLDGKVWLCPRSRSPLLPHCHLCLSQWEARMAGLGPMRGLSWSHVTCVDQSEAGITLWRQTRHERKSYQVLRRWGLLLDMTGKIRSFFFRGNLKIVYWKLLASSFYQLLFNNSIFLYIFYRLKSPILFN